METNNCSDNCVRGIRKPEWIERVEEREIVTSLAFIPDYNIVRNDRGYETSVNWQDNDRVIEFTLKQPTSQHGAALLPRKAIDEANKLPMSRDCLAYERKILNGNPYHGNIVFLKCSRSIVKMIAGTLALGVIQIFQPQGK